ncbi:MAG: MBL fold metallo-hydrolase [Acidobacteriota bacterium]
MTTHRIHALPGTEADVNAFVVHDATSAIVIDCFRNSADAHRLADHIDQLGVALTHVLITHGHPDHYLGLHALGQRFPQARVVVARAAIKAAIAGFSAWMEDQGWLEGEPAMKPRTADRPDGFDYDGRIEVLDGDRLTLADGTVLQLDADYAPAESDVLTTVHVPASNAFLTSDFAYHDVHPWLGVGVTRTHIANWRAQLARFADQWQDAVIYPGHGAAPTDARVFEKNIAYLDTFLRVIDAAASREAAHAAMVARYPQHANADFLLRMSVEFHVADAPAGVDTAASASAR